MIIHSDLQPYHCELCDRRFNALNNLKRHTLVHTGERPYSCNICGQSFTQKGAIKLHQASTHCKERTLVGEFASVNEKKEKKEEFECNICHRKFKLFYWLKVHQQKHEKDDNTSCNLCGK